MNTLQLNKETMTLKELTGTEHKNVLRKANKLLNDLEINSAQFRAQFKDSSGKANVMLELNK